MMAEVPVVVVVVEIEFVVVFKMLLSIPKLPLDAAFAVLLLLLLLLLLGINQFRIFEVEDVLLVVVVVTTAAGTDVLAWLLFMLINSGEMARCCVRLFVVLMPSKLSSVFSRLPEPLPKEVISAIAELAAAPR